MNKPLRSCSRTTRLVGLLCIFSSLLQGCGGGGSSTADGTSGAPQPPPAPPTEPPTQPPVVVQSGISLFAGALGGTGNLDGTGAQARFAGPTGLALDAAGNLYVADTPNRRIRKVTRAGVVSTFAGSGQPGRADGPGSSATFCTPESLTIDAAGNLFVLDRAAIRKITPDASVTTVVADNGTLCDGPYLPGPGPLKLPRALVVDRSGTLYIGTTSPGAVYRLTPSGTLTRLAGDDLPRTTGTGPLDNIQALTMDAVGNVYAVQTGIPYDAVVRIAPDGTVTTLVAQSPELRSPSSIALDGAGGLLVGDRFSEAILRVSTATGAVTTFAGAVGQGGLIDGSREVARFAGLAGIAVDAATGSVFISQARIGTIRKIDDTGNVTTIAGLAEPSEPYFGAPIAFDAANNLYVITNLPTAQSGFGPGYVLQRIAPDGQKVSLADVGYSQFALAVDAVGNDYVVRYLAATGGTCPNCGFGRPEPRAEVVRISPQGQETKLPRVFPDDPNPDGSIPELRSPRALAADAAGNVYFAEDGFGSSPFVNSNIRRLTTAGRLRTIAEGSFQPRDLVTDAVGNLYASLCLRSSLDVNESKTLALQIVKYTPEGRATVLAGSAAAGFGATDGPSAQATFGECASGGDGIGLDAAGNIYLADTGNSLIRRITSAGVVSTVAGQRGLFGVQLGPLPGTLRFPTDVAVDSAGDLIIASVHALLKVHLDR